MLFPLDSATSCVVVAVAMSRKTELSQAMMPVRLPELLPPMYAAFDGTAEPVALVAESVVSHGVVFAVLPGWTVTVPLTGCVASVLSFAIVARSVAVAVPEVKLLTRTRAFDEPPGERIVSVVAGLGFVSTSELDTVRAVGSKKKEDTQVVPPS